MGNIANTTNIWEIDLNEKKQYYLKKVIKN